MTHVIKNPAGTYSIVGAIPFHPRTMRFMRITDPKARSAVMGGRFADYKGQTFAWNPRSFPTKEAAERAIERATQ